MGFAIPSLCWFGVHDSTIANGAHLVTQQFLDQFMTVIGAYNISLVVAMLVFLKSAQCKQLLKQKPLLKDSKIM